MSIDDRNGSPSDDAITASRENLEGDVLSLFSTGSGADDDALMGMVDKHTLQLSGGQIHALMYLRSLGLPDVDTWCEQYLFLRHHNRSQEMIVNALAAISLRKFISQFRFNINTTK